MTAIRIGKSAGEKLGQRVEIIGGLILIAIGIKIFLEQSGIKSVPLLRILTQIVLIITASQRRYLVLIPKTGPAILSGLSLKFNCNF